MLKLAIDCGVPSIRQLLGGITATEHRELTDLLSVEPVGSERMDWHFARLMGIIVIMLGKGGDDAPTLTDWLIERLIVPKTEMDEEEEQESLRENFRTFMEGFAARTGAVITAVDAHEETLEDIEAAAAARESGDV